MKFVFTFVLIISIVITGKGQTPVVSLSGMVKSKENKTALPFVNIVLLKQKDSSFVAGTASNEEGRFTLSNITAGSYVLQTSYAGYIPYEQVIVVGTLSAFLDVGTITIQINNKQLQEVTITSKQDDKLDKKIFTVAANISQSGGSVLQALKNLPGITTSQDGKVELRGK